MQRYCGVHLIFIDLSFPDNLDFLQKIVMDGDGHKLNVKMMHLKIKIFALNVKCNILALTYVVSARVGLKLS